MEYKVESSLWNFPAWSGGKDTLDALKEKNDVDAVESWIDGLGLEDATDTTINDILWFERDMIAEALGYRDWEAYEEGWSEDDLKNAEDWWIDAPECVRKEVSGVEDEDNQDSWWDDLKDEKKVDIYYENN